MLDEQAVTFWLALWVRRLHERFGDRLLLVGHHGSWSRREASPQSDIDSYVILDRIETDDLHAYAAILRSMPHAERVSTGLFSAAEVRAWPRSERAQMHYVTQPLHGTLDGLLDPPTAEDFLEHARTQAALVLFDERHYLLHPHDLLAFVHRLHHRFKWALYALQSWVFVEQGRFVGRIADLLPLLTDPVDRAVVQVVRDWHSLGEDREARPTHYMELLDTWGRTMLARIAARDAKAAQEPVP